MWDESRNALNAFEMLKGGNPLILKYEGEPDLWNTKPPLLIWSMAVCMKLIGVNELSVRLPSALAACVSMIFVFLLMYKVSGKKLMSACCAIALATFPGYIDYHVARNGDFDAMLSMWVVLASGFFYLSLFDEQNGRKYFIYCALAIAGGVLTKGIAPLMILPGFLIFSIVTGNFKKLLFSKSTYVAIVIALVPILGYYTLREWSSPGYLSNMIENELTGRYMNVNEEHHADHWFYFRNLFEWRLGIWFYVIGIAIVSWFWIGKSNSVGKLMLFGLILSVTFLAVISTSKTKLPWYDAPVFPLLSLVCGGFLVLTFEKIKSLWNRKTKEMILVDFVFIILISIYPFSRIHSKTSVNATFEQTYPELYYGDVIKSFFKTRPTDKLTVVYDDYNSHALFYIRTMEQKGFRIKHKNTFDIFEEGELILTCEDRFNEAVKSRYQIRNIYDNQTRKIALVIEKKKPENIALVAKADELLSNKILEIKKNPDWLASIVKKAQDAGISTDLQVIKDAVYILELNKEISAEEANTLRQIYAP